MTLMTRNSFNEIAPMAPRLGGFFLLALAPIIGRIREMARTNCNLIEVALGLGDHRLEVVRRMPPPLPRLGSRAEEKSVASVRSVTNVHV